MGKILATYVATDTGVTETETKMLSPVLSAIKSPLTAIDAGADDVYVTERRSAVENLISLAIGGAVGMGVQAYRVASGKRVIGMGFSV